MDTLIRSTLALSIFFFISKMMGPLKSILIAHQFGVSRTLDAYFVAQGITDVILSIFSFAVIILAVPVFVEEWVKKEEEGYGYEAKVHCFVNQTILLSVFLSMAFILLTPTIGSWIPGFSDSGQQNTLSSFLKINGLILLFSLPISAITGFFYSKNSFVLPVVTNLFPMIATVVSIALLSRFLEVYAIPAGNLFGTATAFGMLMWIYVKEVRPFRFQLTDLTLVKRMKNYLIPSLIFSCGGTFNGMVDQMVTATINEGGVSILSYAQFVMMTPFSLITLPIITTLFPGLSRFMVKKDITSVTKLLSKGFLVITTCLLPIIIALIFYRTALLQLLLHHGRFELHFIKETSEVLFGYIPGILFLSLNNLLQRLFFIRKQFSLLMWMTLTTSCLNLFFDLCLSRHFSIMGIALSTSIVEMIYFLLLLFFLRGMLDSLFAQLKGDLLHIFISSGCLMMTFAFASHLYPISLESSRFGLFSTLMVHLGLGSAVYLLILFMWLKGRDWKWGGDGQ